MSLVARVYVGLGAMIALILLTGGIASLRTGSIANTFVEYRGTAKTSLMANEMAQTLASIRLSALKYRGSSDPVHLGNISGDVANILSVSPDFIESLDGYTEQSSARRIPELAQEYENAITHASGLENRVADLAEVTATSGREAREKMIEAATNANVAQSSSAFREATINLLLGRLYLDRFISSGDTAHFARSSEGIERARNGIQQLSAQSNNASVKSSIDATLGDFDNLISAANELSSVIQERDTVYRRIDEIGPEAMGLMQAAVKAVVDRQSTLGPSGVATAQNSITLVSSLVVIGLMIGLLLAFFTGQIVKRRLAKVTEDMTLLAEGNLDIELDTSDKHEIGKMTAAMVVFQENARTARDLGAEIKEAERKEKERLEEERAREEQLAEKQRREDAERDADRARMHVLENFQNDMQRVMDEAASGNFSVRMSDNVDDENLKRLSSLVNGQLKTTETNIADFMASIGELAKGNLAVRIKGDRQGVFLAMQEDFNASVAALSETISKILHSGNSVSGTSIDLKNSSKDMSKRAEDNAATVEETSAAVEEITASIRQVVASAKAADQATQRVRQSADETRSVSTETEASINAMTDASAQINRVVKVIEDIAFQINLLALNAGVEAARAGEAGLGFSVVASEVRALALRSQEAVQEITQVIEQSNLSVEAGAQQVGLSRQALEGIITEVEVASGQISEIASAVEEQARGIEEVNTAIRAIDVNAQKNASTLEKMMLSSQSLSDEANQLSSALGEFGGLSEKKLAPVPNATKRETPKLRQSTVAPKPLPKAAPKALVGAAANVSAVMDEEGWDEF